MRRLSVLSWCLALLVVFSASALAAKKADPREGWPTKGAVQKAEERIKWLKNRTANGKYKGNDVTFQPCDLSDIDDKVKDKGFILGELTNHNTSADKLPPAKYLVYVRKAGDQWEAFFCEKGGPVAKSTEVKRHSGNEHDVLFENDGTTVRYSHWQVAW